MKRALIVACGVAGISLLIAGCGDASAPNETDAQQPLVAAGASAPNTPNTLQPLVSSSAAPIPVGTTFALGESQTTNDGVTVTPLTLENPTDRVPDPSFSRRGEPSAWTVLDAELCAGNEQITKTGYGFRLVDAAHREYRAHDSTSQPFEPTISHGELAPGECVRGYVNFQLPDGVEIDAVRWEYPGAGGPLRWALD